MDLFVMDFKDVLDFFDGSIFSEEYLGDFTEIRQQLDLEIETAGDSRKRKEKAWLELRQSIFSMLTGNLTKAFDHLREIRRIKASHQGGYFESLHTMHSTPVSDCIQLSSDLNHLISQTLDPSFGHLNWASKKCVMILLRLS
jgi:hypothetical protein